MDVDSIIAALDAEIETLTQAHAVLSRGEILAPSLDRAQPAKPGKAAKRVLNPEARKRMADAQR